MINRRKGILGLLAVMAGSLSAQQKTSATTSTSLLSWKQSILLNLDNFSNDAIRVSFKGETIEITCQEIMDALWPERK